MATLLGQPVRDGQRRIAERVRERLVERARARLLGEPLEQPAERRGAEDAGLGLRGALAQGAPGDPGDREHDRDEDEVAGVVVRVVVDDDRRAAEHDGEPEPRPDGVGNLAEQERRSRTGDGRARRWTRRAAHRRTRARRPAARPRQERRTGSGGGRAAPARRRDRRHGEPQRRARLRQRVVSEARPRARQRSPRARSAGRTRGCARMTRPGSRAERTAPRAGLRSRRAGARTGGLRSAVARRPEPCMAALRRHCDVASNPEPPWRNSNETWKPRGAGRPLEREAPQDGDPRLARLRGARARHRHGCAAADSSRRTSSESASPVARTRSSATAIPSPRASTYSSRARPQKAGSREFRAVVADVEKRLDAAPEVSKLNPRTGLEGWSLGALELRDQGRRGQDREGRRRGPRRHEGRPGRARGLPDRAVRRREHHQGPRQDHRPGLREGRVDVVPAHLRDPARRSRHAAGRRPTAADGHHVGPRDLRPGQWPQPGAADDPDGPERRAADRPRRGGRLRAVLHPQGARGARGRT